jgi:hypothetical protein
MSNQEARMRGEEEQGKAGENENKVTWLVIVS